jgi:hypothetical protein
LNINQRLRNNFEEEVLVPAFNILDDVIEWLADNVAPEDVVADVQLETWAYDNGFKKFE